MTEPSDELQELSVRLAPEQVEAFLDAFDDAGLSVSAYEGEDGAWYGAILTEGSDVDGLRHEFTAFFEGPADAEIAQRTVNRNNWLEANQQTFPPLQIGRFWVHGSHIIEPPPAGTIPLAIDAGMAFGTGEHGSTHGCLLALDRLARRRAIHRLLDMGCGSAILAIAAAKCRPCRGFAVDLDPGAVRAAEANAAVNGVAGRLRFAVADGFDRPALRRGGHYDLVFANILAGPLITMAPDLARVVAPRGRAVLAGLLQWQAPPVIAAYRAAGMVLADTIRIGDWATLVLRPGRSRGRRRTINPFQVDRWPLGPV